MTGRLYDTQRWKRARRQFLAEHPLCRDCRRAGRVKPATDIHHVVPRRQQHSGDDFDEANLEALCHSCHSLKGRKGL